MLNVKDRGERGACRLIVPLVAMAVLAGVCVAPASAADLSAKVSDKHVTRVAAPTAKHATGSGVARRIAPRLHTRWRVASLQPLTTPSCPISGLCLRNFPLILGVGF